MSFLTSGIYYGSRGLRGMYFDWTYLLAIAGLILTLLASARVKSTFAQYSKGRSVSGLTGARAARYILDSQGRAYINKSKTKKKAPYYAKAGSGKKGTMKRGTNFYVLRTSGKWSQMANGYWVKTSLTKKTVVYPNISPSVKVNYKAKLKKKTVSRSGPSNSYIKKKTFKKNRKVTVIGTYGSWSKISSGQWLPSSRLKR